MRVYKILSEATSDDIFRKLDALEATIADRATTAGEKESAAKMKARLEKKLQDEFPNAQRPVQPEDRQPGASYNDWMRGFGQGMDAYDEYQRDKSDATADKSKYKAQIGKLKAKRKEEAAQSAMGNVEARERVKDIDRKIERLYRDMFPEEWEAIKAKRATANASSAEKRYAKQKADNKAKTSDASNEGVDFKTASKMHPEVLKKLSKLIKVPGGNWQYVLSSLSSPYVKRSESKAAVAQLNDQEQEELRAMVSAVHNKGFVRDYEGYTEKQKSDALSLIPRQAGPVEGEALSYAEFKQQFEDTAAKTRYKKSRFEVDKSLFDIFGASSISAYYKQDIVDRVKKMKKEDKAAIVAGLKRVNTENKVENSRVERLIAMFSN